MRYSLMSWCVCEPVVAFLEAHKAEKAPKQLAKARNKQEQKQVAST